MKLVTSTALELVNAFLLFGDTLAMSRKPHVAAIVQARMRSTRLPGKVLKPIVGRPLLWHILHRLKKSEFIETICVATTRDPADDALAAFAASEGAVVVRGPEDDVLGRFALATHRIDPDVIVRVDADAPLVDAGYVDFLIGEMTRLQADFLTLKPGVAAIHDGADVLSRWALDKLVIKAHGDPIAREHFGAYFKIHPEFVKTAQIDLPEKWRFKGAQLSVDTPADVTFIEAVYDRLHAQAGEAALTDLVALLQREPELLELNAPARARSAAPLSGVAIVRCDGTATTGLGRVRRCLTVARALGRREGFDVRFALNDDADAKALVAEAGFAFDVASSRVREIDWLLQLAETHQPVLAVLDVQSDLSATSVMRLRGADMIVATIDDLSSRRLVVDASFYPPTPHVFAMNWEGAEAEPQVGWEWIALDQAALPPLAAHNEKPRVIISMGAGEALTLTAVRALAPFECAFNATVVVGPDGDHRLEAKIAAIAPRFTIVRSAQDLPLSMGEAHVGLVRFGAAALELAARGIPGVYVWVGEDDGFAASAFERAGMGVATQAREADIRVVMQGLIQNPEVRRAMSAAARMNLDGRGPQRIANLLKRLVDERAEALAVESAQRVTYM